MLGSYILRDLIIGNRNEDADLFHLERRYGVR